MLQLAADILGADPTGMRDCEVQAMQRGCLSTTGSEDGVINAPSRQVDHLQGKVKPWGNKPNGSQ